MSSEKHPNACEVIESVEENLNFGIAMEHTGSLVAMQKCKFFFLLQKREYRLMRYGDRQQKSLLN